MKKMFWFLPTPLIISLILLTVVFYSCEGSTADEAEVSPQEITITFWEYMDPSMDDTLDEILYEFSEKTGYTLAREHFEPTQLRDAFIQEALTGGGPDFIIAPSDHLGSISVSDTALPAKEVFDEAFLQGLSPQAIRHTVLNGTVWGVPILLGNSIILFYNTDMVKTPPQTWDELIAEAKRHTKGETYGLTYNITSPFFFAPFLTAFGGGPFQEGTNIPSLDTPAMVQALQFVADLKFKHEILTPKADSSSANKFFASGHAAFLINGPWAIGNFVGKVPFALTPIPLIGDRVTRPFTSSGTAIFNKSLLLKPSQLKAVRELVKFMTSRETQVNLALMAREQPALMAAQSDPRLQEDPFVAQFILQIQRGVPLPSIPEMRFIFQSVRPLLEEVVFGNNDYAKAANQMQKEAERQIAEFKQ